MLIKIKARGYDRASESFKDKWLESSDLEDAEGMKELKKLFVKYALKEAKANRSTTFRFVLCPDDDDDNDDLIDFSSKPKKKSKKSRDADDEDDDDDE